MGRPPIPAFAVSGDQKTEAGSGTSPPRMKRRRDKAMTILAVAVVAVLAFFDSEFILRLWCLF